MSARIEKVLTMSSAFYLMWIAGTDFRTFDEFKAYALGGGYRKGLPQACAASLEESGAPIFLLHDDGRSTPCSDCIRNTRECPECWKHKDKIDAAEFEAREARLAVERSPSGTPNRLIRIARNAKGHHRALLLRRQSCPVCGGLGRGALSSGGCVTKTDGARIDYVRYRHLAACSQIDPSSVVKKDPCTTCSGCAVLPLAMVRGFFLPSFYTARHETVRPARGGAVERILPKAKHYLLMDTHRDDERVRSCIDRLKGAHPWVADAEGHGDLAVFRDPVPMPETPRYPGIKRWDLKCAA
jgi:hypothetical protein